MQVGRAGGSSVPVSPLTPALSHQGRGSRNRTVHLKQDRAEKLPLRHSGESRNPEGEPDAGKKGRRVECPVFPPHPAPLPLGEKE